MPKERGQRNRHQEDCSPWNHVGQTHRPLPQVKNTGKCDSAGVDVLTRGANQSKSHCDTKLPDAGQSFSFAFSLWIERSYCYLLEFSLTFAGEIVVNDRGSCLTGHSPTWGNNTGLDWVAPQIDRCQGHSWFLSAGQGNESRYWDDNGGHSGLKCPTGCTRQKSLLPAHSGGILWEI